MIRVFFLVLALLTLSLSQTAMAKDSLQTIETSYARIHFQQDYQAFAEQVADKFDAIYLDVSQRVGFEQNEKIDFLIADDFHQANGYAIPLASGKIVKIFTSAPRSEQTLGSYEDWLDLVISHELTHKIQMSEPSRSWRSMFDKVLFNADVVNFSRYPRWVSEGYATLIETEYTHQGRVNSDYVKALLQQWAIEGQLPSYEAINGNGSYTGNRMAYYQGSAFLFWLQQQYGADKLSQLWHRTTAAKYRDFNDAFKGLFLQSPKRLYKQFVAEQTYHAKKSQQSLIASGKLWQNNAYQVLSSEPSAKQDKLLQLEKDADGFISLNVFALTENVKAKEKFIKENKELLENDPKDIPDTLPLIFNHQAELSVKPNSQHQWRQARWLGDGHALVLQYLVQDNHELGFELAKVTLATGKVEKITDSLRVHDYAVMPDLQSVVAVTHYAGFNQLVRISLNDGSWQALTDKKLNVQMDNLTLSPDGKKLALIANHNKHWQIHLFNLKDKQWQVATLFESQGKKANKSSNNKRLSGNYVSYLRWQTDGLYFSRSQQGKNSQAVNIFKLNFIDKTWQQLTQGFKLTTQAFTLKQSTEDELTEDELSSEQLFYLVTTSQGQDTYSQSLATDVIDKGRFELQNITEKQSSPLMAAAQSSQNYGFGPQTFTLGLGGYVSDDENGLELIVKGGDPLGRLRWQAAYSDGDFQKNIAANIKSNWLDLKWYGEIVDSDLQETSIELQSSVVNVELGYATDLSFYSSVDFSIGLGSEKVDTSLLDDQISHYRLQGQYHFADAMGKLNYGYDINGLLIDYSGDYQNWQRVDYGFSAFLGYADTQLGYQYASNALDDNAPSYQLLMLGGQVTSATSQVANHQILDSRLPLAWQAGFEFEQHSMSLMTSGINLFYLNHKTDDLDALSAYGLEISSKADNMSPLFDGITVKAGFTWFETREKDSNNQYHLSVTYQFK
ncbi:MAG: hypothetical protein MJK12_06885 [Colwellia sp.]|nr:hypothetical protein [Colwellia sp.]